MIFQALQAVAILQAATNPILVYRPHRGEKKTNTKYKIQNTDHTDVSK